MSAVVNGNMTKMFEAVHYAKSSTHCLCVCATLSIKGKLSDRSKENQELMMSLIIRFVYIFSS